MTPMLLPLSCSTDATPCNDTSSFDGGLVLVGIAALLAVIVTVFLVRRGRPLVALFIGVVFVALGVAVGSAQTASFGWFAYAPLSSATFVVPQFATQGLSGLLLASAGIFALGCGIGGLVTRTRGATR